MNSAIHKTDSTTAVKIDGKVTQGADTDFVRVGSKLVPVNSPEA